MTWPGLIAFPYLFLYRRASSASKASSSMKRKDIKAAIQGRGGIEAALIVPKGTLTSKQRKFAEAIAAGETGAAAYRSAYDTKAKPQVQSHEAHKLRNNPKIAMQIEALALANEAAKYADAVSIRQLVISSLIQTVIDPEVKAATRVSAAKILGNVTEVAAFTQRSEVTHVKDSGAIRDQIMQQLKTVILDTGDAETIDADRLLSELAGENPAESIPDGADRTHGGDATFATEAHSRTLHTNPPKRSAKKEDGGDISDELAFLAVNAETPPLSLESEDGEGDIFDENDELNK